MLHGIRAAIAAFEVSLGRVGLVGLAVAAAFALGPQSAAIAAFPDPLPNFAHPAEPHDTRPDTDVNTALRFEYGNNEVPTLIIYREFTDVGIPAGMSPGSVRQKVFSSTVSNAQDYFEAVSFGKFGITPAAESDGTPNDGVVVIRDMTLAEYRAGVDTDRSALGASAIKAADPFVDYASFDSDGDGILGVDELQIIQVYGWSYDDGVAPIDHGSRATDEVALSDGVVMPERMIVYGAPDDWYRFYTHELMHTALGAKDSYGYGAGEFDQMGMDGNKTRPDIAPAAWTRIHLGWITPTVVTRDGYYWVGDAQKYGRAFILYDPARGTDDYFIVENRNQTEKWDTDTQDRGLVIWRIHEPFFVLDGKVNAFKGWMQLMVPRGGYANLKADGTGTIGTHSDAWDPSDLLTPQRTMSRPWSDETTTTEDDNPASNVAVRAIGPSGNLVRAYFDVPGPGLLVDTANRRGDPMIVEARAGETVDIPFTAMNTGEAYDTFSFGLAGTPDGWSQQPRQWGIGAGVSTTHTVGLVIPDDTLVFRRPLSVRGLSATDSSIECESQVYVDIVRDEPDVTVTLEGFYRENPRLHLSVADPSTGNGIAELPITLRLGDADAVTHTIDVDTDRSGVADVALPDDVAPGEVLVEVQTPLTGHYLPVVKTAWGDLVERRVLLSARSIPSSVDYGDTRTFSATVEMTPSHDRLAGRPVRFVLPDGNHDATTDAEGVARVEVPVDWAPGQYEMRVEMADPTFPWPYDPIVRELTTRGETVITYEGPNSGYVGEPSRMSVRVSHEADPDRGVEGIVVKFCLTQVWSKWQAQAITNENGVATLNDAEVLDLPAGDYSLAIIAEPDPVWRTSQASVPFAVELRPTDVSYIGAESGEYSDEADLSALVTDGLTGDPLPAQAVTFTLGSQTVTATTGDDGRVAARLVLDQADGPAALTVSFGGDDRNAPAEVTTAFDVLREKTSVLYTGDDVVPVGGTALLSAAVSEEDDGSFGDLTLAAVRFWLTPSSLAIGETFGATCDADGFAEVLATGLSPDLWTVTAGVRSPSHWADSDSATFELVVPNPLRQASVGAIGTDSSGAPIRVAGSVMYRKGVADSRVRIDAAGATFVSTGMRWLTGADGTAIAELDGELDGGLAVARLCLSDPAHSGTPSGSMRVVITAENGDPRYDSGTIMVEKGRVVVR